MKPQLSPPSDASESTPKDSEDTITSLMQHAVTLPEFQAAFSALSAFDEGGNMDIGILLKRFGEAADAINSAGVRNSVRSALACNCA